MHERSEYYPYKGCGCSACKEAAKEPSGPLRIGPRDHHVCVDHGVPCYNTRCLDRECDYARTATRR